MKFMEALLFTYMVLLGGFSVWSFVWAFGLWFKVLEIGTPKMRNPPPPPVKDTYNEMNAINEYWKNTQQ
jgi:hypothetical protein